MSSQTDLDDVSEPIWILKKDFVKTGIRIGR